MMMWASSLLTEGRWVWKKFSKGYSVDPVGMTCIGMPYDVGQWQHATTASLMSASSCGGAGGDVCKLPKSMPYATVTLGSWAPLCSLIWVMGILWGALLICRSRICGLRRCSPTNLLKLCASSRRLGWLPIRVRRPRKQSGSPLEKFFHIGDHIILLVILLVVFLGGRHLQTKGAETSPGRLRI